MSCSRRQAHSASRRERDMTDKKAGIARFGEPGEIADLIGFVL